MDAGQPPPVPTQCQRSTNVFEGRLQDIDRDIPGRPLHATIARRLLQPLQHHSPGRPHDARDAGQTPKRQVQPNSTPHGTTNLPGQRPGHRGQHPRTASRRRDRTTPSAATRRQEQGTTAGAHPRTTTGDEFIDHTTTTTTMATPSQRHTHNVAEGAVVRPSTPASTGVTSTTGVPQPHGRRDNHMATTHPYNGQDAPRNTTAQLRDTSQPPHTARAQLDGVPPRRPNEAQHDDPDHTSGSLGREALATTTPPGSRHTWEGHAVGKYT